MNICSTFDLYLGNHAWDLFKIVLGKLKNEKKTQRKLTKHDRVSFVRTFLSAIIRHVNSHMRYPFNRWRNTCIISGYRRLSPRFGMVPIRSNLPIYFFSHKMYTTFSIISRCIRALFNRSQCLFNVSVDPRWNHIQNDSIVVRVIRQLLEKDFRVVASLETALHQEVGAG